MFHIIPYTFECNVLYLLRLKNITCQLTHHYESYSLLTAAQCCSLLLTAHCFLFSKTKNFSSNVDSCVRSLRLELTQFLLTIFSVYFASKNTKHIEIYLFLQQKMSIFNIFFFFFIELKSKCD